MNQTQPAQYTAETQEQIIETLRSRVAELQNQYDNRTKQLSEINLQRRQLQARVKELEALARKMRKAFDAWPHHFTSANAIKEYEEFFK